MKKTNFLKILSVVLITVMAILICVSCENDDMTQHSGNNDGAETTTTVPAKVNNSYSVNIVGGTYYMDFEDYSIPTASGQAQLQFSSIGELVGKIKEHNFEEWQYLVIKSAFYKDANGIKIFDIENAYEPILPTNVSSKSVYWNGSNYSFYLEKNSGAFAYLHYYNTDDFNTAFNKEYQGFFSNSSIQIVDRKEISDRNSTETIFTTSQGTFKHIRYNLTRSEAKYYVDELYRIEMKDTSIKTSDTVPSQITVFFKSSEKKFVMYLYDMDERPSEDWILSFDMGLID